MSVAISVSICPERKAPQRPSACALTLVSVDDGDPTVGALQTARELIGPCLGSGEDERLPHVGALEKRPKEVLLSRHRDRVNDLDGWHRSVSLVE